MKIDKENLYQKIIEFLNNSIKDIDSIYIFGSYADDNFTKDSDMDIAFLNKSELSAVEIWDISSSLSSLLNIDVDLVDLKHTNIIFRFEIISKAIKIYETNKQAVEKFEDLTYSFYIDFNEIRSSIIDDIKTNGISRA